MNKPTELPTTPPPPPPPRKERITWFIKLTSGQIFNRTEVMSLRRCKATAHNKTWVATVTPESVGGPAYNKIWMTEDDAKRVCPLLGIEYEEE